MKRKTTIILAAALAPLIGNVASAFPGSGSNCAQCHTSDQGSLDLLPLGSLDLEPGQSGTITFDVTALGGGGDANSSIAVSGLSAVDLGATPDLTGWNEQDNGGMYLTHDVFGTTGMYTLDLMVAGDAAFGQYPLEVRLTGGGAWSTMASYAINVVPEPSTAALLGVAGVAVIARLRRRRRS